MPKYSEGWIKEKRKEYWKKMTEMGEEMSRDKNGLQERWDKIIKTIWELGRELGMVKEIKEGE